MRPRGCSHQEEEEEGGRKAGAAPQGSTAGSQPAAGSAKQSCLNPGGEGGSGYTGLSFPQGDAGPSLHCSSSPNPLDTPSMDTCTSLWKSIPELQLWAHPEPDSSSFQENQDAAGFLLVLNDEEQTPQQPKGFIPGF